MNPDRTEVLELGNHGIDPGTWTGTPDTADGHAAPLPEYPKPEDLPPQPITAEMRREAAIWTLHDLACLACFAAFAWLAFAP